MKWLGIFLLLVLAGMIYARQAMIVMPGQSFYGSLPPMTAAQTAIAEELKASVVVLSDAKGGVGRAGNRSTWYPKRFAEAAAWIHDQLTGMGYATVGETFVERGAAAPNMDVNVPGTLHPEKIVLIGAHYDAFQGTPGADDNASGVAAVLYLARVFRNQPQNFTIRLVFFVNEEPPAFWTADMGSWVYAKKCRAANEDIVAMLSLESIGYYSEKPKSQTYPDPMSRLYPTTGNFIAFVSDYSSRTLNKRAIARFREHEKFPSEGGSPPGVVPGVGWSDHWSFSQEGYPAIMLTDTATFRNPHYHTPTDTFDRLDYQSMARVVEGIEAVVRDLSKE